MPNGEGNSVLMGVSSSTESPWFEICLEQKTLENGTADGLACVKAV